VVVTVVFVVDVVVVAAVGAAATACCPGLRIYDISISSVDLKLGRADEIRKDVPEGGTTGTPTSGKLLANFAISVLSCCKVGFFPMTTSLSTIFQI